MVGHNSGGQTLSLKWIYLAYIGIAFSSLVIGIIAVAVQGAPEPVVAKWGISDFSIFAIVLYCLGSILAVVFLYMLLKARALNFKSVGLSGRLSLQGAVYALIGVISAFILYGIVEAALKPIGINMFWRQDNTNPVYLTSSFEIILIILNAVILGPIAEEIIFRGYLLTALLQKRKKEIFAFVLSALIFTSVHVFIGPGTLVFIFFWAFIPAFLYFKFGNLYPAILFHVLNNFLTYFVFPMWVL